MELQYTTVNGNRHLLGSTLVDDINAMIQRRDAKIAGLLNERDAARARVTQLEAALTALLSGIDAQRIHGYPPELSARVKHAMVVARTLLEAAND